MDRIDKRQIIDAAKANSSSRDYADACELCGCTYPFEVIGFRGICYDCKPIKPINVDKAVNELIEKYGEFDANLSGKKSENNRSNSDS